MSLYLGENLISGQTTLVGESRNIGQIIPSAIPLTDAGLHLLDGSLIQGDGIYSAFVTHIAGLVSTYPNLFVSESDWQTAVTTYGVCGKFVYNSTNNTVRLPKITGIVEGTTDITALGDLVEAGLPNIKGGIASSGNYQGLRGGAPYGAFALTSGHAGLAGENSANANGFDFDASRSNPIYGNSSTVQPQTIKAFYYIVLATSTKTEIEVDIDQIATDLNGKADTDLSNVPTSKGILEESYVNGSSWYRVYSDGWCVQGGESTTNTVNLLKTYKNTDYNVQISFRGSTYSTPYFAAISVDTKTTSNFTYGYDTIVTRVWQASGYIV